MDIEPTTMGGRKTLDLIQKNEVENRDSRQSNEKVNRSTIFDFLYFWSVFFLSISFFIDLTIYFCFYQKKNNSRSYKAGTFFLRIITDALFIAPLLLYIRYALTNSTKNYIIGIVVFFPQFILSIISIIVIYNQDFITKDDEKNEYYNNSSQIDEFADFVNFMLLNNDSDNNNTENYTTTTDLTDSRISALKISPILNLVFYLITILLTFLKVFKNF